MSINLDIILWWAGFIAALSAAIGIISTVVKKAINKVCSETINEAIKQQQDEMTVKFEELSTQLKDFNAIQNKENTNIKKALLASTRDHIHQAHAKYMELGHIGEHSLFVVEELYKEYKNLGGNSFIDLQMKDLRKLKKVNGDNF